jgi:cysteine desulfuration protein SufE
LARPAAAQGTPGLRGRIAASRRAISSTRPSETSYISVMNASKAPGPVTIDEIVENFALLEEWDDRYRYVIELGRALPPFPETARRDANKVQGCASQVWLATTTRPNGAAGPTLTFVGDSDAHIVRGLIAILFALYSGKGARDILGIDAEAWFNRMGLREHLTPQRSNGFRSMVERIRSDARAAVAGAPVGA